MNKTSLLMFATVAAVATVFTASSTRAGDTLTDQPDSLHAVLDIKRDIRLEEISGLAVSEVRIYSSAERTRIGWWKDDVLFLYTLNGAGHESRASALVSMLRDGMLVTYVAEPRPRRRHGAAQISDVKAIQISAPTGVQIHAGDTEEPGRIP